MEKCPGASSWNPQENINSIKHDKIMFLFQEGLDLLNLVWIVVLWTFLLWTKDEAAPRYVEWSLNDRPEDSE